LEKKFPADVQVLKVEVPSDATELTPWKLARLSKLRFYLPTAPKRKSWSEPGSTGYEQVPEASAFAKDTDVYTVIVDRKVAVTPISLDMTANVSFAELEKRLKHA
jgi:broad specificity polyphosphatase/5'/3'-nucleotidase SurE